MEVSIPDEIATPITPIPSMSTIRDYSNPTNTKKGVVLDDVSALENNTVNITLRTTRNNTKSSKKTFNYNPLTDTPSKIAIQAIKHLKLPTSSKTQIETIIMQCVTLNQHNTDTASTNDDFTLRNSTIEDEKQFIADALGSNNETIMEDIVSIYSFERQCFLDVGFILCNKHLYLINASKLKRWKQFKRITKIESILRHKTIDEITLQILSNMNITLDSNESNIIKTQLIGTNIREIKQKILLSANGNKLIFEMDGLIHKLCIEKMYDEDAVSKQRHNEILQWIWEVCGDDISQKRIQNDLWITLDEYITFQQWNVMKSKLNDEEH
eukprot:300566_1